MRRENTLLRNGLRMALLGPVLALGAPSMAIADNTTIDTEQNENIPAGEPGDPIELDPIVAIGRMPASTVVVQGHEADTPSNRRWQDVLKGMPNILVNAEGTALPAIRGIDSSDPPSGMMNNISTANRPRANTLVDGVARPYKGGMSVSSSSLGLWDVETVEVAKGPQSTSTGRSSLTGAFNVSTRDPVHEWEAAVRTGYFDQRGTVEGAAMMNVPLVTDQVALRFAFEGSDGEHYIDFSNHRLGPEEGDEVDDQNFEHYRGKLLFTPSFLPDTELVFNINATEAQGKTPPRVEDWKADDLVALEDTTHQSFGQEQTVYSAKLLQGLGEKMDLEVRVSYLENTLDVIRTPRLIEAYPGYQWNFATDTTSAEALLHFEESGFIDKGLLGVAYEYEEDDAGNDALNFDGAGKNWYFKATGDKENFAIFGEVEAGIGGGFTAIGGGRFEWDKRRRHMKRSVFFTDGGNWGESGDEVSDEAFSPKLGIRYDGADKYVAGYTYSQGWRPGGIDLHPYIKPTIPKTTFDPERLKNHEIWVRSNPLDRLRINGSVFYYRFEDYQLRVFDDDLEAGLPFSQINYAYQTGNIPEVKGYGMELDGQYAINDPWRNTWTISGALGLLKTKVTDAGPVPEYDGRELSQSPDVTWNLGLGWVSPRGFDAEIRARHTGSFQQSHKIIDKDGRYFEETDAYTLFDFKAGYETKFRGTELRIDAWVENLTDRRYKLPSWYPDQPGNYGGNVAGRPRTFGVAATVRF